MSPSEYSKLKDALRELDSCNQDDMGKQTGYFFSRGMNFLRSLFIETEQEFMAALGIKSVDLDD